MREELCELSFSLDTPAKPLQAGWLRSPAPAERPEQRIAASEDAIS